LKPVASLSKQELLNREVMVEDFVKLFEPKDYEGRILRVLNKEIVANREQREEKEKQKEFMKALAQQQLSQKSSPAKEEA
jgi:hypothetical protein